MNTNRNYRAADGLIKAKYIVVVPSYVLFPCYK